MERNEETKKCLDCKETKPLDQFYKDRHQKDGKHSYCKSCSNIRSSEYKKNNKDKIQKHKEYNRDIQQAYNREYYRKNQEKILERSRKRNEKNKEELKKYHKEYREKNKERLNQYQKEYRTLN